MSRLFQTVATRLSTRSAFRSLHSASTSVPVSLINVGPRFFSTPTEGAKPPTQDQSPEATPPPPSSSSSGLIWLLAGSIAAAGGYYLYSTLEASNKVPTFDDYQAVYTDIASLLENVNYDDGSYGPVLIRLAWHAAGTYDKETKTGGSNGATMRFNPESAHGANAGLSVARDLLEPIKKKYPWISYSDLWSLAGVVAVQEMGGPDVAWKPGRSDAETSTACTPDGRLPDASQAQDHLRKIFYRMGFNDQEIVALAGAHALGRCHTDRSGFDGPWTFSPTTFSNDYFKLLLSERWVEKKWKGPKQFVDKATGSLMMLPSDLALIQDRVFKKHVEQYAKDPALFASDFSKVFQKLEELGVPFGPETPEYKFKRV